MACTLKIGPFTYEDDAICALEHAAELSLVGQELTADTLTATVRVPYDESHAVELFCADGHPLRLPGGQLLITASGGARPAALASVPYGTPAQYFVDGQLLGRFYVREVRRTGRELYQLHAHSAMGLLERMESGGGLFDCSFAQALAAILSQRVNGEAGDEPVFPYTVTPEAAAMPVAGWLPHASKRENLHQLLFAHGVSALRGPDGNPIFTIIYPDGAKTLGPGEVYDRGSVSYQPAASRISVVEHTYSALGTEPEQVIFEGEATGQVWFANAPIIPESVRAVGLTVTELTVNGAVVRGTGTLYGRPYTHSAQTVTCENEHAGQERIVQVTQATLVNYLNSSNLLSRLQSYYGATRLLQAGLIGLDARPGQNYRLSDPFGELTEGYVESVAYHPGDPSRTEARLLCGYRPAGEGGLYRHCVRLDRQTLSADGGVFDVARHCPGAKELLVIVIGGGDGGESGCPGHNGADASGFAWCDDEFDVSAYCAGAEGGEGGEGGAGGAPGKVLYATIRSPAASYRYSIGAGGAGGAASGFRPDTLEELRQAKSAENPTRAELEALLARQTANTDWNGHPRPGLAGTASTFGPYSSEDGTRQSCVYDPIGKQLYAAAGAPGQRGGRGGAICRQSADGESVWLRSGEDVTWQAQTWRGGQPGSPVTQCDGLSEVRFAAYGGNGAGAAVGLSAEEHPAMHGQSDAAAAFTIDSE